MPQNIGKRLRKLRQGKGLTQDDIAKKIGVLKQQVYNYETGRNTPPVIKLVKLAKFFKVSVNWLSTGKEA